MSEELDRMEQTEHEFCSLECTDCGAYPMQAVYEREIREIICTKCGYYLEEDYFDPETVARPELKEEAELSKEQEFYQSLGLTVTKNLEISKCPINPQSFKDE